ncbi:MAG: RidA family protein [Thermodesulfobacteriota bacterium]
MNNITEFSTDEAPAAIGPYSQAVRAGGFLFLSGAIPIDAASGKLITGGIEVETRSVLTNISAVLAAAGLGLEDVVKTTVYLSDIKLFERMNKVYGEFFSPPYPARATLEVSRLPKGVAIEIEAVALTK